jgi:uncharacterized membrane protein
MKVMKKFPIVILVLILSTYIAHSKLQIQGEFNGWDKDVVVKLTDGTCWKQAHFYFYFYFSLYPNVELYNRGGVTYLKVQGCPEIQVYQVSCLNHNRINNTQNTDTNLKVQNNTNKTLYFCYVAFSGSSGWQSNGWYKLEPFYSRTISIGNYTGNIYLYAEYNNGENWWGDSNSKYSFCIHKFDAFNISNSDKSICNADGYIKVQMINYNISPGTFTWNLNE